MGKKYKETNLFIIISFIKTCANRRLTQPVPPQIIIWWQSCFFAVSFHFYLVILFWVFGVSLQISKWRATYFAILMIFRYWLCWEVLSAWIHLCILSSILNEELTSLEYFRLIQTTIQYPVSTSREPRPILLYLYLYLSLYFYLYLSVVFHDKYQSYRYEKIQEGNLPDHFPLSSLSDRVETRGWYIHGDLRERAPHTIFSFSDEQKQNQ